MTVVGVTVRWVEVSATVTFKAVVAVLAVYVALPA
jgi:hypothetical protein